MSIGIPLSLISYIPEYTFVRNRFTTNKYKEVPRIPDQRTILGHHTTFILRLEAALILTGYQLPSCPLSFSVPLVFLLGVLGVPEFLCHKLVHLFSEVAETALEDRLQGGGMGPGLQLS